MDIERLPRHESRRLRKVGIGGAGKKVSAEIVGGDVQRDVCAASDRQRLLRRELWRI